ncbi:MAG: NADH:flavin oxidoreductase/NADH oxidase [Spirochaetaceae bacterium]|nr:MAG: NADH:flavin oxidoreductase/NADH oxidase [Spirochaetaceae bacterium]
MDTPTLLSPLDLPGGGALKNRIVMPPLVIWKAGEAALVTEDHLRHYRQTVPGCGLVMVEATAVSPEGRLAATQLGLFEDRQIPGLRRLADTIREAGALPGIQLHHAGGRTDMIKTWGATPLAPSVIPGNEEVRELTESQILRIIDDFATAARRALEAGYELLELHGAHGYLGSQFLSPRTNRRGDRWGGSLENRSRFLHEVIRAVRGVAGNRALVSCRLGVAEAPPAEATPDSPRPPHLQVTEGVDAARRLAAAGLDMIHVSHAGGMSAPSEPEGDPERFRPDPVLQLARPVREAVTVPVIGVSGIVTAEDAEEALTRGYCNLVAIGRGMLADPQWARKVTEGRPEEIERCIHCKPRCFHFKEPEKCPARRKLGIGPPGA